MSHQEESVAELSPISATRRRNSVTANVEDELPVISRSSSSPAIHSSTLAAHAKSKSPHSQSNSDVDSQVDSDDEEEEPSPPLAEATRLIKSTPVARRSVYHVDVEEEDKIWPPTTEWLLRDHHDVPEWMIGNPYVHTGYRVKYSWLLILKSLFRHHNETCNVWTHLFGFISFVVLTGLTLFYWLEDPHTYDRIIISIFLFFAQGQMLFSAIFHLIGCKSAVVYKWSVRLDYSGISIMIVGSFVPILYYAFACNSIARITYVSLISALGIAALVMAWIPVFSTPKYLVIRTSYFLFMGLSAVVPFMHMFLINDFLFVFSLAWRESIMGALYVGGSFIYMSKWPESKYPGKFDMSIWSSHSVWHMIVMAAAYVQLYAILWCHYYRKAHPCI